MNMWNYSRIGVVFLLLCVLFWFCAPHRSTELGRVTELKWSRTVRVDAWTPLLLREWKDQIVEREEIQGVQSGWKLANPPNCSIEPFDDTQDKIRCDYWTQAWKFVRFIMASGVDKHPTYPEYLIKPTERVHRTENYSVEVDLDHRKVHTSISYTDFNRWNVGDAVWVKTNQATGLDEIEVVGEGHGP